LIISEIGQNFCGDIKLAKEMIKLSKDNGATLAKFQLYDSVELYGKKQNTELSKSQAKELFEYGKNIHIPVFFSVFDVERIKWCEEFGVRFLKIAFSQKDNKGIWNAIPSHMEVFVSCNSPHYDYTTLYCVPKYPAKLSDVHFNMVNFKEYCGFSDHTIGLTASKVALSRGAFWIEKHFCIDHQTGVDAKWSMTPDELRELVEWDNEVQKCL
jgi:sialic acid synthase SpsE